MKISQKSGWAILAMAVSLPLGGALRAAEPVSPTNQVEGVLTAKGPNWIEVKAVGAASAVRYRPRWIGGLPKDGGGLDKAVVSSIQSLAVTNRVRLSWIVDEGPRVLSVESLTPPPKGGRLSGVVVSKGENWIEIKSGDVTDRYTPRWIGGMPAKGGGLDKEMLRAIAAAKVGDKVSVEWSFEERKRLLALRPQL